MHQNIQCLCETWQLNVGVRTPRRKSEISLYTDNTLESIEFCEELHWNHERSTPRRSETNGIAWRAVRRVEEGTPSVSVQSGLQESWWVEAMECNL